MSRKKKYDEDSYEDSYDEPSYYGDDDNDDDTGPSREQEIDFDSIYDEMSDDEKEDTELETTSSRLDDIPPELRCVASNKGKYYLTNEDLLPEVIKSKEVGYITDRLARMLMLLAERYSRKSNFVGYSYRQDMVSAALLNLCKNALKFNPERSQNPFAFYTTAIKRSFLQYMENEKEEHYIRDTILLDNGHEASANYDDNIVKKRIERRKKKNPSKRDQRKQAEANQLSFANNLLEY